MELTCTVGGWPFDKSFIFFKMYFVILCEDHHKFAVFREKSCNGLVHSVKIGTKRIPNLVQLRL